MSDRIAETHTPAASSPNREDDLDHCAECSAAAREYVPWPCPVVRIEGQPQAVSPSVADSHESGFVIDEHTDPDPKSLLMAYMLRDGYSGAEVQAYMDQHFADAAELRAVAALAAADGGPS